MTKAPTPTEKSKKQRDNTKMPSKTSITQRLRTNLGRSVGVTIATQLVWFNRFTGSQPSHQPQNPCNQKDTHFKKNVNNHPHKGPTAMSGNFSEYLTVPLSWFQHPLLSSSRHSFCSQMSQRDQNGCWWTGRRLLRVCHKRLPNRFEDLDPCNLKKNDNCLASRLHILKKSRSTKGIQNAKSRNDMFWRNGSQH